MKQIKYKRFAWSLNLIKINAVHNSSLLEGNRFSPKIWIFDMYDFFYNRTKVCNTGIFVYGTEVSLHNKIYIHVCYICTQFIGDNPSRRYHI